MQDLVKTWATVWEFHFQPVRIIAKSISVALACANLGVGKSEFCAEREEEWGHNILVLLFKRQEYLL